MRREKCFKKFNQNLCMWRTGTLSIKESHIKKKSGKNKMNAWDKKQGIGGITKIRDLPGCKTRWIIGWVQKAELSSSRGSGKKAHSIWIELMYLHDRVRGRRNQLNYRRSAGKKQSTVNSCLSHSLNHRNKDRNHWVCTTVTERIIQI